MNPKGRAIALDIGIKRTGIAETDPFQWVASGLTTVATPELISYLQNYTQRETVVLWVVGQPKQLNGQPSESAPIVEAVAQQLTQAFPHIPIHWMDERFTSKMAFQSLIDSGVKKLDRRNKALVDEVAATILLQDYLAQKKS